MVELEVEDYNEIIDWFTIAFGSKDVSTISKKAKKTFWKLTFLAEDKIKDKELHLNSYVSKKIKRNYQYIRALHCVDGQTQNGVV